MAEKVTIKISDDCICCGACAEMCPVSAISMEGNKYEIDPEKCIKCGSCVGLCPVSAIKEHRE